MASEFAPSSSLSAIVWDLDDTLGATSLLRDACRRGDRQAVRRLLPQLVPIPGLADALEALRGRVKLGVVTASPEWYAHAVLAHLFPAVQWDVVLASSSSLRGKPYPDLLVEAIRQLSVRSASSVAYIGDSRGDIEAAYHASMRPVLATWVREDEEATRLSPDAVLTHPREVLEYAQQPSRFLPPLEASLSGQVKLRLRLLEIDVDDDVLNVHVLGRYFVRQGATVDRHLAHQLSQQIAKKSSPGPFLIPRDWVRTLTAAVKFHIKTDRIDTVSIIPAKPTRDPRMERLLDLLETSVSRVAPGVHFAPQLLRFDAGASPIKNSGVQERLASTRETLRSVARCKGKRILLIDDVLTAGATLHTASALLRGAGAAFVQPLAIAKTVSEASFEVSPDVKSCACGRLMTLRSRGSDGKKFWGCKGYPNYCQRTESIP